MPLARVSVVCFDPSASNPADATSVTCPVPGAPLASRASTPIIEVAPRASIWRGVAVALSTATPEFGSELQAANSANAAPAHASLTALSMGCPRWGVYRRGIIIFDLFQSRQRSIERWQS